MGDVRTIITMEISPRKWAQVNKTPYLSYPSTPCLRQQPHENKTDQHATYNTLKSVPTLPR
jgi:hypothetical protein